MIGPAQFGIDHRGLAEAAGGIAVGFLAFARHIPPPFDNEPWKGAFFDTVQDLAKNNDRIGNRRISAPPHIPQTTDPNAPSPDDQSKGQ